MTRTLFYPIAAALLSGRSLSAAVPSPVSQEERVVAETGGGLRSSVTACKLTPTDFSALK